MRHEPHLYVPRPWADDRVAVSDTTSRHLSVVLRIPQGTSVGYTDGEGVVGRGTWRGEVLERGSEDTVDRPISGLTLAVAPPKARERQRFIVEKLQELGVPEMAWVRTAHTEGRPPRPDKATAWAVGALEQSRGAWLMTIDELPLDAFADALVADAGGVQIGTVVPDGAATVVIGPEGGFSDAELELYPTRVRLGPTILRTETAAIAAALAWVDRTT